MTAAVRLGGTTSFLEAIARRRCAGSSICISCTSGSDSSISEISQAILQMAVGFPPNSRRTSALKSVRGCGTLPANAFSSSENGRVPVRRPCRGGVACAPCSPARGRALFLRRARRRPRPRLPVRGGFRRPVAERLGRGGRVMLGRRRRRTAPRVRAVRPRAREFARLVSAARELRHRAVFRLPRASRSQCRLGVRRPRAEGRSARDVAARPRRRLPPVQDPRPRAVVTFPDRGDAPDSSLRPPRLPFRRFTFRRRGGNALSAAQTARLGLSSGK